MALNDPRPARMKYRKVAPAVWNDAKFRAFDDPAKLTWFLLLTHPLMTALGAMRNTREGLAIELGWPVSKMKKAFAQIESRGMVVYDEELGVMWLPNYLRYNAPESPNVVLAWRGALEALPEGELRDRITEQARRFAEELPEAFGQAFLKAFGEAFAKPSPNLELELELEQELEQEKTKRFALPDWVPADQWNAWIEARTKKRNAPTDYAKRMAVTKLEELRDQGHDPAGVLAQSAFSGWTDLWPLKRQGTDTSQSSSVPFDWWKTQAGICAKGRELGIPQQSEYTFAYGCSVVCAAGDGPWFDDPNWRDYRPQEVAP